MVETYREHFKVVLGRLLGDEASKVFRYDEIGHFESTEGGLYCEFPAARYAEDYVISCVRYGFFGGGRESWMVWIGYPPQEGVRV